MTWYENLFSMINSLVKHLVGYTTGTGVDAVTHEGWITSFVNAITDNSLILFFVGLSLIGIAVGFITRLIQVRNN